MDDLVALETMSSIVTWIVGAPFEWCAIPGGRVTLVDARLEGGDQGGEFRLAGFWMAKYPVTNAHYQAFIDDPGGFPNAEWWEFSAQARQWHMNHPRPSPGRICRAPASVGLTAWRSAPGCPRN